MFDARLPHSLTYTPDIGEALATLGTAPAARGRTWHLPTAPALTGQQYVELAAGTGAQTKTMSLGTMRFAALFDTTARETLEMAYQFTKPYIFESGLFESTFGATPTTSRAGVTATMAAARRSEWLHS